jgi:hypothetical protein
MQTAKRDQESGDDRMRSVEYQHIGHDPRYGELSIWNIDDRGCFSEHRREFATADQEWMEWSHQRLFDGQSTLARGRVELATRTGSVYIVEPALTCQISKIAHLVRKLDRRYPRTRWYLFGGGFNGESVMAALNPAA